MSDKSGFRTKASNGCDGPLQGLRVVELGSTVAGPFCGRLFSDFGAEVIKVEMPGGDPLRTMGSSEDGASLYAASIFRNKSNVVIDLRKPEGQQIVRDLATGADVLIENFKPGTLERWGLGYDALSERNPRLVMVRISGFGQDGPYSQQPGYGVIGEAVSGLRSVTGDPDRPPARMNTSLCDYITGLYAAFGALAAIRERESSGLGQMVDAALYECAFSFMEPHVPAYDGLKVVAQRTGSALPGSAPNNLYVTRDGKHIHITAVSDAVFRRLCQLMGDSKLADPMRWGNARNRVAESQAVDARVQEWVGSLALNEIEGLLKEAGVPASKINTIEDVFSDPHFQARGMLKPVWSDEIKGDVTLANVVPRLSRSPGNIRHAGRSAGSDSRTVMRDVLGLEDGRVQALLDAGIVK